MHIAKQKNQKKRLNLFPLKMFRAGKQENIMGIIFVRIWPGRRTRRGKVIFYTH
jgi:hypothetical protein